MRKAFIFDQMGIEITNALLPSTNTMQEPWVLGAG
jgi:hypothetical protein